MVVAHDNVDEPNRGFAGRPFSAIFHQPQSPSRTAWRIRRSGGRLEWGDAAEAVLQACDQLGISVQSYSMASPANVGSVHLKASFLDGGLTGESGNYWFFERGAWIVGSRAVLL